MQGSHPFDVLIRLVPAQMLTGVVGVLAFGLFAYLLVKLPFWFALPAGVAVLAAAAYVVYVVLDRVEQAGRKNR